MTTTQLEADAVRAEEAEAVLALDEADAGLEAAASALTAHSDARATLRHRVAKSELKVAARDLADGVGGLIRVAPFTATLVAVAFGMSLARRNARRRSTRRV